jgi:hypothetical protein
VKKAPAAAEGSWRDVQTATDAESLPNKFGLDIMFAAMAA